MLSLLVGLAALADLLIWRLLPSAWQDWLFLPFLLLVTWVIFNLRLDLARQKRQVWLNQYLEAESSLQQPLQVGWLGLVSHLLVSLLLALLLLLQVLLISWELALTLALSLPLLHFIKKGLNLWLLPQVRTEYRRLLGCYWLVIILTLLLTALLTLAFVYQPQPWLIGSSLSQVINEHLDVSRSSSLLGALERGLQLVVLTQHWALQNFIGDLGRSGWLGLLAWLLVLGVQASLALAVSYWLVAADYLIRKLYEQEN
ncbi:hypothetical protein SAMN05660443_0979 [Marinospirillum celere]|uniref:Uncharacterized protein n=1 Tax=Marinospirillum celere TaxID=1122252 RepID=A0A1I1FEP2_9GAMM|nr:hypothetical protein [Marinospirillum celere]SFB97949.1 hypothetical protein SAMN05660443_0979 [Marinospirillum celere]